MHFKRAYAKMTALLSRPHCAKYIQKLTSIIHTVLITGCTSWHLWMVLLWASYQIRKIAGCACAGNAGNVSPRRQFQRKPLVSDPGMHHGTCVTHVPWCMSGSLTCDDGENVPGIPGACAPAILRIWQEAHVYLVTIAEPLYRCFHFVHFCTNLFTTHAFRVFI